MRFLRRKRPAQPKITPYPILLLEHADPFDSEASQAAYIRDGAAEIKKCWPHNRPVIIQPESQIDQARTAEALAQALGVRTVRWPLSDHYCSLAQLQQCIKANCQNSQPFILVASRTFNGKIAQHAVNMPAGNLSKLSFFMLYSDDDSRNSRLERLS